MGKDFTVMTMVEQRRRRRAALREDLLRMASKRFFSIFEDDGWQDAMEEYALLLPHCPDDDFEDGDAFLDFMNLKESELVPDLLGRIIKDVMEAEMNDLKFRHDREIKRLHARIEDLEGRGDVEKIMLQKR